MHTRMLLMYMEMLSHQMWSIVIAIAIAIHSCFIHVGRGGILKWRNYQGFGMVFETQCGTTFDLIWALIGMIIDLIIGLNGIIVASEAWLIYATSMLIYATNND